MNAALAGAGRGRAWPQNLNRRTAEAPPGQAKNSMADSLSKAVAALTTKRARVQAVSTWIRAHGADAQLAERALQALLDHVAARLFADEAGRRAVQGRPRDALRD